MSPARDLLRAAFYRGGTSNGILISGQNLPEWRQINTLFPDRSKLDLKECAQILQPVLAPMFGSPDPYGRQLNGMGGGLSSLSKAVIVDRSTTVEGGLDYLFLQIGIKDGQLDLAGNCGNMTSAVAPFGFDNGLLEQPSAASTQFGYVIRDTNGETHEVAPRQVCLYNLNTNKVINAVIHISRSRFGGSNPWKYEQRGNYVMHGVPGHASPIDCSYVSPGGAKTGKSLPTGNVIDKLVLEDGTMIEATLTDISNPGVFIRGSDIGLVTTIPRDLEANQTLMDRLERIRRAGATKMGMDPSTPSIPKIVILWAPSSDDNDAGIVCQALSMEQAHKAVPMTLALNLGVACKIRGTIPNTLAIPHHQDTTVVRHPSGTVEVGASIDESGHIKTAKVIRTARLLMDGYVNTAMSTSTER